MVPVVPDDVRMFRVVQSLPGTLQPRTAAMLVSLTTVIEICTQLNDGTQLSDTVRDVCEALEYLASRPGAQAPSPTCLHVQR